MLEVISAITSQNTVLHVLACAHATVGSHVPPPACAATHSCLTGVSTAGTLLSHSTLWRIQQPSTHHAILSRNWIPFTPLMATGTGTFAF